MVQRSSGRELTPQKRWSGRRVGWMAFVLVALTAGTFSYLPRCVFTMWDDNATIEQNPRLRPPTLENVAYYWRRPFMGLYVPVTYTVWSGLARVAEGRNDAGELILKPAVFHAANLIVHVFTALAVFGLLRRLLKHDWAAWAGAAVFALHPVQVEPVAWVSGLKDLLCGLFMVLAVGRYVRFAETDEEGRPVAAPAKRLRYYAWGMAFFALAMLSKPSAMVTPLVAGIVDWLLLRRPGRKVAVSLTPWLALSVACMVWTKLAQPATFVPPVAWWARPLVAGDALAFYIYKLLWPLRLCVDYGRDPGAALGHGWAYWTWTVPAVAAGGVWVLKRQSDRWHLVAAGAVILLACLAPVLGLSAFDFQRISTVADHYLYAAMLGPALVLGAAVAYATSRQTEVWATAARFVPCCLVLVLGGRSALQTLQWRDAASLSEGVLAVNPTSFTARNNLALCRRREALAAEAGVELAIRQGRTDEAIKRRAEAAEKWSAAEQLYAGAVALEPAAIWAHYRHGESLAKLGRFDEAAEEYGAAIRLRPLYKPSVQKTLNDTFLRRGLALMETGHADRAAESFQVMLQLEPGNVEAARCLERATQAEAAGDLAPAVGD